jgi:hypothetical protein
MSVLDFLNTIAPDMRSCDKNQTEGDLRLIHLWVSVSEEWFVSPT